MLIKMVIKKKTIAIPSVKYDTTFSTPLSLVLTKTLSPPPVIAPEAPSDLPPWSKQRTMMIIDTANKIQSYHCNIIFFFRAYLIYNKVIINANYIALFSKFLC